MKTAANLQLELQITETLRLLDLFPVSRSHSYALLMAYRGEALRIARCAASSPYLRELLVACKLQLLAGLHSHLVNCRAGDWSAAPPTRPMAEAAESIDGWLKPFLLLLCGDCTGDDTPAEGGAK